MSADNGYVIRQDDNGKYVLQMYFASADKYPNPNNARPHERFDTLEQAVLAYQEIESGDMYASEYGLSINVNKKADNVSDLDIQQFNRKVFPVDGVRVTVENMEAVAAWCSGNIREVAQGEDNPSKHSRYIFVKVTNPMSDRQTKAFVGDWVLFAGHGFKVYSNRSFRKTFENDRTSATRSRNVPNFPHVGSAGALPKPPMVGSSPDAESSNGNVFDGKNPSDFGWSGSSAGANPGGTRHLG